MFGDGRAGAVGDVLPLAPANPMRRAEFDRISMIELTRNCEPFRPHRPGELRHGNVCRNVVRADRDGTVVPMDLPSLETDFHPPERS
jgi:hypothetical protein